MENKYILLSLKPKYFLAIYLILFNLIIIIISLFCFELYDLYQTRGYYSCDDNCKVIISVDPIILNKVNNIDYLRINKNNIKPKDIKVSDILSDDNTKSNYIIVTYEVDKLDDVNNTFLDVKIYSNKDKIINKIINIFLGGKL